MVIRLNDSLFNKISIWWLLLTLIEQPIGYILEAFDVPFYNAVSSIFVYICLVIGFLLLAMSSIYKTNRSNVILFCTILLLILLNILIFPENRPASIPILRMTTISIMAFYSILYIRDYSLVIKMVSRIGYVIVPMAVYVRVFLRAQVYRDYANFAIMLFPYIFAFCFSMLNKSSIIDTLYFLAGTAAILMFGNRTTFLLLLLGLVLLLYKRNPSRLILGLLFFIGLLLVFQNQIADIVNAILSPIYSVFNDNTVYSRTLAVFQSQKLLDLSGREAFFFNAFELIKKSPLFGNGIGADMIFNYSRFGSSVSNIILTGLYSHNGFLEMSVEFGIAIAVLVWGWVIFKSIIKFRRMEYNDKLFLFLLVLLYGLARSFLGYPYWYNWYFWGAIAFLVMKDGKSKWKEGK